MTDRDNSGTQLWRHSAFYLQKCFKFMSIFVGPCMLILLAACNSNQTNSSLFPRAETTSPGIVISENEFNQFAITTTPFLPFVEQNLPVNLDTSLYTHPQGLLSLEAPDQWSPNEMGNRVSFVASQPEINLKVIVLNTGYPLDNEAFEKFIDIQEKKNSIELEDYIEIDRIKGPIENSILITNEFYKNGILIRAVTYYLKNDIALVIAEFNVNSTAYQAYLGLIETVAYSIEIFPELIAKLPIYAFDQAIKHSNGYFSLIIPPYWDYNRTDNDHAIIETFISPDERGIIQTLVYDDGEPVTKKVAGELALMLLRENYTKSITIMQDQVLEDNREKLTWRSNENSYQGITAFAIQGTGIYLVTIMWSSDPEQHYQTILEDSFLSYSVDDPSG